MTNVRNLLWSALLGLPLLLLAQGCAPECVDAADCVASKGAGSTCVDNACVAGNPQGDAGIGGGGGAVGGGGGSTGGGGGAVGGGGGSTGGGGGAVGGGGGTDDAGTGGGGGGGGAVGGGGGTDDAGTGGGGTDDAGTGGGGGADDAGTGGGGGSDDAGTGSDGGANDAGTGGDGGTVDAGTDAGLDNISAQIAAVRAAIDTTTDAGVGSLTIQGALVTFLKPLVTDAGVDDPAGFFIQGARSGPALFVAIDPSTVSGGLAVGDAVDFTVDTVQKVGGLRRILAISGVTKSSSGNPTSGLAADIDAIDFGGSASWDLFESRVINVSAMVMTDQTPTQNSGYRAVNLVTAGYTDGGSALRLRLPAALMDAQFFGPGCTFSLANAPFWRNTVSGLPSAFQQSSLVNLQCPAPAPLFANTMGNTSVSVYFSRDLKGNTVDAGAFSASGLTIVDAMLTSPRKVLLTTTAQAASTYTLFVDPTVADLRNSTVTAPNNTVSFQGLAGAVCSSVAVISAVYGAGGNNNATYTQDFVELKNRTGAPLNLTGWSLQYGGTAGTSWIVMPLSGVIPPHGYFLAVAPAGANGIALPTAPDLLLSAMQLGGTNGIIALVDSVTQLTACPAAGAVADLVAYGTGACREGATSAGAISTTNAIFRAGGGCTDTNANSADFSVAAVTSAAPRNTSSAANTCSCP